MLKMHLSSAKFGKQLRWKSTILSVGLLRCSCLSLIGSRSNSSYGSEKIITSAVLIFGPDSHVNLRASLLDVRDHPEAIVRCLLFLMGWRGIIFLSESKGFSFNTRLVWVAHLATTRIVRSLVANPNLDLHLPHPGWEVESNVLKISTIQSLPRDLLCRPMERSPPRVAWSFHGRKSFRSNSEKKTTVPCETAVFS